MCKLTLHYYIHISIEIVPFKMTQILTCCNIFFPNQSQLCYKIKFRFHNKPLFHYCLIFQFMNTKQMYTSTHYFWSSCHTTLLDMMFVVKVRSVARDFWRSFVLIHSDLNSEYLRIPSTFLMKPTPLLKTVDFVGLFGVKSERVCLNAFMPSSMRKQLA